MAYVTVPVAKSPNEIKLEQAALEKEYRLFGDHRLQCRGLLCSNARAGLDPSNPVDAIILARRKVVSQ